MLVAAVGMVSCYPLVRIGPSAHIIDLDRREQGQQNIEAVRAFQSDRDRGSPGSGEDVSRDEPARERE